MIELERGYAVYDYIYEILPYSLAGVRHQMKDKVLDRRRNIFKTIFKEFENYDYMDTLPIEGITPYMFPLFFDEKTCNRIVTKLNEKGIESNVYNFDINRKMLNPDFKKCVGLPCHQGISSSEVDKIITLVNSGIRG